MPAVSSLVVIGSAPLPTSVGRTALLIKSMLSHFKFLNKCEVSGCGCVHLLIILEVRDLMRLRTTDGPHRVSCNAQYHVPVDTLMVLSPIRDVDGVFFR